MIRHRLPVNVYQYKATISGFPIRDLLVLLIIVCLSLLAANISIVISVVLMPISLLTFFVFIRSKNSGLRLKRFFPREIKREEKLEAAFHMMNGHCFVGAGNHLSIIFRVTSIELLAMREWRQEDIISGLTEALNQVKKNVEIISLHGDYGEAPPFNFKTPFQTFLRITVDIGNIGVVNAAEELLSSAMELLQHFKNAGLPLVELNSREELRKILIRFAGFSKATGDNGHMAGDQRFSLKAVFMQFLTFTKTNEYVSDIVVRNASYSSGPFYQTILESMNIPMDIILSLREVGSRNQLQYINRLLAERRTEYRFSRGMPRETEYLKQQVSDLERMREKVEKNGDRLLDLTFTIRVYAEHPAVLNSRVLRIENSLGMMGFWASKDAKKILRKLREFSLNMAKPRYLMDTGSIASILPVFRRDDSNPDGILLGFDDLSEKAVRYDPFSQDSYNSLVIGETGSGKSYFTKMFLMRSLRSGVTDKAIIFDPLNEYSCKLFGKSCQEYNIGSYSRRTISEYPSEAEKPGNAQEFNIKIIKPSDEELENDEILEDMLSALNREMSHCKSRKTLIAIDECHILLRNLKNAKTLGAMVRHSRHYNTSIMNISQNTDDFLSRVSATIAYNSNRIFIFRTRNISESHKKVLKIDGFDIPRPENLAGGKSHQYSECIVSDGTYCRTLRVVTSDEEDSAIKESA